MQVLPSPGMLPSAAEAGGMVHDQSLAMTAPGTAPGFDSGSFSYPMTSDLAPGSPGQSGPDIAVPTDPVGGQPRDPGGRWAPDDQIPGASPWRPTPAAS